MDSSFLEYSIFGLFTIDISNYIYIKATLAKEFHIQPSELECMPAWEYELFIQEINKAIKEENKKNKEEEDKYNVNGLRRMAEQRNDNYMKSGVYKNMPNVSKITSVPNVSNPSIPKLPPMSGI